MQRSIQREFADQSYQTSRNCSGCYIATQFLLYYRSIRLALFGQCFIPSLKTGEDP